MRPALSIHEPDRDFDRIVRLVEIIRGYERLVEYLLHAMRQSDDRDREVLALSRDGLKPQAIALKVGISRQTVYQCLNRARKKEAYDRQRST